MNNSSRVKAPVFTDTLQTTKDQACGLFITYLNNLRLVELMKKLADLKARKDSSDQELIELKESIAQLIKSNRGGVKGMHGFIGERVQVSFANSESLLAGENPMYVLIDDNGMTDYLLGDTLVQQKACLSDKAFGLTHVLSHAEKYPDFIEQGGIYQIPKDFFAKYQYFVNMPKETAFKLRREELRAWEAVQKFHTSAPDIKIQPMSVTYAEIQAGSVSNTIDNECAKLDREYKKQKRQAELSCKATLKEGLKATGVSAALEGAVDAGLSFTDHALKKNIRDFDKNDWKEISIDGAKGVIKGGIRGAAVYTATNFSNIPAPIATAGVTATFGIVNDFHELSTGALTKYEFAESALEHCTDALVSATCAKIGEKIIPIPIIGSLLGNAVGMLIFGTIKRYAKSILADGYQIISK